MADAIKIPPGWLPTAESIKALPEPLRRYVHDLETNCDPAGMVREAIVQRENADALVARVRELEAERDALASSLRLLVAEEGQTNHLHDRPGQWDDDGRPCHRCHAFDDARRLLGIDGAMPSYGGNHADE